MKQQKNKFIPGNTCKVNFPGFTLIELIVVITILAILGTIAFIALQGYTEDARDSARLSDISNIKTSLELYSLEAGKYPLPDGAENMTYIGGTIIRKQGTIGEKVTSQLSRQLNEKPIDPLYNIEYIYSVLPNQTQYQIMGVYEGEDLSFDSDKILLGKTFAVNRLRIRIDGSFNGMYVKTGNYIIPTPSLITSLKLPQELNLTTIKSQVVSGGTNIPEMGIPKVETKTGGLKFTNFQVYNGGALTSESSTGSVLSVYDAIANTYSGSSLENDGEIKTLLSKSTDEEKIAYTKTIVLNTVTSVKQEQSCDETSKPLDNGNIIFIENPTSVNQEYVENSNSCGFTCDEGYEYSVGDNACMESQCSGSIPTNATSNAINQSYGVEWNYNDISGVCTYECAEGYYYDGDSCESQITGDDTNGFIFKDESGTIIYPESCNNLLEGETFKIGGVGSPWNGSKFVDGVYWIKPDSNEAFKVYCDMTTDGGGWTLIAKGREGWTLIAKGREGWTWGDGQGTIDTLLDINGNGVATLNNATINSIWQKNWKDSIDGIRIHRVGLSQEFRRKNTLLNSFSWSYFNNTGISVNATLNGINKGTGNTYDAYWNGPNDCTRVFLRSWDGHNYIKGWSAGAYCCSGGWAIW